jgi:arginyl-tRNA synthetase
MSDSVRSTARELLRTAIQAGQADDLGCDPTAEQIPIERPKRPEHGDYASKVALALAKQVGKPPRVIGDANLAEVTVAGPGFINLRFSDTFWQRRLLDIRQAGREWGRGEKKAHPKLCIEYLSANPTGPLHFAHGRHAAVGDSLTRLLRFAGDDVVREFYLSDAGNQVAMLALSVWTRYMEAARVVDASVPEVTFPENGYRGDYIRGIAKQLCEHDGRRQHLAAAATPRRGMADHLGLAKNLGAARLGRGYSPGSRERAVLARGVCASGDEAR